MIQNIIDFVGKTKSNLRLRTLCSAITREDKESFDLLLADSDLKEVLVSESALLLGIAVTEVSDVYYLKKLLSIGLNPNEPDNMGLYPIHKATETGNVDAVEVLLKSAADPNAADPSGVTALHIANSFDGLSEISDLLIRMGANIYQRDKLGKRYLM
ncbi:ankyrin repeat domain-containing protein [Leptospira sp. 2 VSF19]|uniref:Ankyrin repeat domain-containing protein n=1 Tax=Leptospira soteropolitanensis TaxID=2950025 RepID=A0AAW5VLB5_9LEPT|nr:ankyrin repeat domain-containing protein [Leptospira soteropolitanensis]MCW7493506.1 ankyrin repeat domain-containing protein [Leptospira soteropolitanensis]MCW7500962.1 ankyrin repeat domain-containing protein [Leptospira soteropolitanensis]MCW7523358.1 ankyrin repeat domain-containing protein [Leptospira soteropolitanensis]MCW7527219.1 ankyrin repeat domain-containing protein [Leptospira soteropolitanensis]MCW7531076.1 ankyrin repeat domain-containing protein [Leptospira soteropolitanensi